MDLEEESVDLERAVPRLEDYHVSPKYAFLLQEPLTNLPDYFHPWMTLAEKLEELIENESIRDEIHKGASAPNRSNFEMPLLDHTRLSGHKQWRLAQVALSCLTQGYVWVFGEDKIPSVLPKQLAIPYAGVSEHLGVPPSISNTNFGLANWKLKDQSKPPELENLDAIITISGGSHSSWFFMVYVAVEIECAPGLSAILDAQQAVKDNDPEQLAEALQAMDASLQRMKSVLNRMYECCDPEVFFLKLRPFLSGWDSPAFKNKGLQGLVYEGVSKEPKQLAGGSAAQSSTIPSFDAALGVQPTGSEKRLTDTFRLYMLPQHRDFITAIRHGPSINTYVTNSENKQLRDLYNQCLTSLEQFRSYHIQLCARYIIAMSSKRSSSEKFANQALAGTGGTGFMDFLKNLRDTTKKTAISD